MGDLPYIIGPRYGRYLRYQDHLYLAIEAERRAWEIYGGPDGYQFAKKMCVVWTSLSIVLSLMKTRIGMMKELHGDANSTLEQADADQHRLNMITILRTRDDLILFLH